MPTSRASDPLKVAGRNAWYAALVVAFPAGRPNARLAARFESFANTIQTRLDTANGTGPSLGGNLQAQVGRALSQVLRQAPANGSYATTGQAGTQMVAQALSVATLTDGTERPPAIAPRQAALLREAALTKGDLLSVLDMLQPLSAFPDPSDIAALTAVLRSEVRLLIEEFSRTTLRPRAQRVRVLLGGLLGWNPPPNPPYTGDSDALITLLNLGGPLVSTLMVEQQIASQDVLTSDIGELLSQWLDFRRSEPAGTYPRPWARRLRRRRLLSSSGLGNLGPRPGIPPTMALGPASAQAAFRTAVIGAGRAPRTSSYAERLIRADLLLPVVGQDASRVGAALDAIGLSAGEQETTFLSLRSLVDMDLLRGAAPPAPPALPGTRFVPVRMTITDILDWAASMADAETLDLLRQAGQLGLNLIADQADELFWLVASLLSGAQAQMRELGDAQVQTELLTLTRDLNLLASLAV